MKPTDIWGGGDVKVKINELALKRSSTSDQHKGISEFKKHY
jgi:hypothetical protein